MMTMAIKDAGDGEVAENEDVIEGEAVEDTDDLGDDDAENVTEDDENLGDDDKDDRLGDGEASEDEGFGEGEAVEDTDELGNDDAEDVTELHLPPSGWTDCTLLGESSQ